MQPVASRHIPTIRERDFERWHIGNAELEGALEEIIDAGAFCGRIRRYFNRPWTIEGPRGHIRGEFEVVDLQPVDDEDRLIWRPVWSVKLDRDGERIGIETADSQRAISFVRGLIT